jgi:hypothetical protein
MRYFGPWADPAAALTRYRGETNDHIKIASSGKPAKPRPDFPMGLTTFGGRYGFFALESGPYVAARGTE